MLSGADGWETSHLLLPAPHRARLMKIPQTPYRNWLLAALSRQDRRRVEPLLEKVDLPLRFVLESPNVPIQYVYFLESGIASVVAVGKRDERIEIGLIGREGISGMAIVLDSEQSPHATYMQISGEGHRIAVDSFRTSMKRSPSLSKLVLRGAQAFAVQTAHTAVANARGKLEQRLARWLLMAHDRVGKDELPLTHEFIALMLGVRRAGVTEGIAALESGNMIRAHRGRILIINRAELEKKSGGFYGVPEMELRRLMPMGSDKLELR